MRDAIVAQIPSAAVSGKEGRLSSFEITVDEKLAYSKLSSGGFPDRDALVAAIVEYSKSGTVPEGGWCTKQESGCVLM